ncbi:hypothetical protein MMC09_001705 [Bachmanniomyces sp. S44760]|nr:hypothetical protein [Bachmanniomyces sp. S44760]
MDAPRAVLIVFLLIFIFVSPDTRPPTPVQQFNLRQLVVEERQAVDLLNSSSYGDLEPGRDQWINVTGLRENDGYAWDLLSKVQERAREQMNHILGPARGPQQTLGGGTIRRNDVAEDHARTTINVSEAVHMEGPGIAIYQNMTSILRGRWIRSKIEQGSRSLAINLTALAPRVTYITREFDRNITGSEGDLRIKLDEKSSTAYITESDISREIRAELIVKDETSTGDGWQIALHGVHYPKVGGAVLTTSSEKFAGIFSLPQFARSQHEFELSRALLNRTLPPKIKEHEKSMFMNPAFPWSSSPNNPGDLLFPTPHCEYIVYLQQHPLISSKAGRQFRNTNFQERLSLVEEELRYPSGAPLYDVPPLTLSALIYSPDCGFILESKGPPEFTSQDGSHLRGPKLESFLRTVKQCMLIFAMIIAAEITLLIRQMKDTSTPSTRSRISFYSIAIMAMGDGFVCLGFQIVSMFMDAAFLILISTAFLGFLCVSFFGMKFLMDIWTVQAPERREAERRSVEANVDRRPPISATTNSTLVASTDSPDTLPLPVTAPRLTDTGATPIILPSDQDTGAADTEDATMTTQANPPTTLGSARREMGALYSRFYFVLLMILFLSLHATTWPTTLRSMYTNVLSFAYLSFWAPQIYRNVMRNCRKAIRLEFVVGQSILRLVPFLYFFTFRDNIMYVEVDLNVAYVLAGWVWIQVWALISQEILGPRFFVPKGWAPPAYDYHPVLRENDEESGAMMPIGFTQATSDDTPSPTTTTGESKQRGEKSFDCAICMQSIDVPILLSASEAEGAASSIATNLLGRRAYMVTPCRHIFHSACLEGWMRYRLQCPICRENLPPL